MTVAVAARRKTRRTQEERTAEARAKLIGAAITLICEKGFVRTTMAEIASLAGLTRGAIQHHFSGRVELVTTILHEVEQRVVASFTAAAPNPSIPIEKRIDILIDSLSAVGESSAYLAAMEICFTSRADPDLQGVVRQSMKRSSDHFRILWQRTFGAEVPEETISDCRRVMVAVARGLVMSRLFSADPSRQSPVVSMTLETTRGMIKLRMLSSIGRK